MDVVELTRSHAAGRGARVLCGMGQNRFAVGGDFVEVVDSRGKSVYKVKEKALEVSAIAVGGPKADCLFIAFETIVVGVRKGKSFFRLQCTEKIHHLFVDELQLFTCGEFVYRQFHDGKESCFFASRQSIHAITILNKIPVLASATSVFILSTKMTIQEEITLSTSPITVINPCPTKKDTVVFGTVNGAIGILCLLPKLSLVWQSSAYDFPVKSIFALHQEDLIVAGHENGTIRIWHHDELKHQADTQDFNLIGLFATPEYVLSCDTHGKVLKWRLPSSLLTSNTKLKERKTQITLENEISALQNQIHHFDTVNTPCETRTHFNLDPQDHCYRLQFEFLHKEDTIQYALLKTQLNFFLDHHTDYTLSRPNFSHSQDVDGIFLPVSPSETKLSFRVRTVEGEQSSLSLLVVSKHNSHCVDLNISALSLHEYRASSSSILNETRPLNWLEIQGNFSPEQFHHFLSGILPQLPAYESCNESLLIFQNVCSDTILICEYRQDQNRAKLSSDSISTLAILREQLRKIQQAWNIIEEHIDNDCIPHFLRLLQPKLAARNQLDQHYTLLQALRECGDSTLLSDDDLAILQNATDIEQAYEKAPNGKAYLTGVLTDFFVDRLKFAGIAYSPTGNAIDELISLLHTEPFDLDSTVDFFRPDRHFSSSA